MTYLVFSLSVGKPYWIVYFAMPAVSLLCGWGFAELVAWRPAGAPRLPGALAWLLLVMVALVPVVCTYEGYLKASDPVGLSNFERDERAAKYVNESFGEEAKVVMSAHDLTTTLVCGLDCYRPDNPAFLGERGGRHGLPSSGIYLLGYDAGTGEARRLIETVRPDLVLLRYKPETNPRVAEIADFLAEGSPPVHIGNIRIFRMSGSGGTDDGR